MHSTPSLSNKPNSREDILTHKTSLDCHQELSFQTLVGKFLSSHVYKSCILHFNSYTRLHCLLIIYLSQDHID